MHFAIFWILWALILPLITGKRGGSRPRPRMPRGRKGGRKRSRSKPKRRKSSKAPKKKGKKSEKPSKGKKSKKVQKSSKSKSAKKKKKRERLGSDTPGGDGGEEGDGGDAGDSTKPETNVEPGQEIDQGGVTPRRSATPAVVTPEMKEMRERRRQDRLRSDEINAKITLEQLKDENGQPHFSSGRFGAVFLLPESCNIQKIHSFKEEDDVQSQSD